jgi:single-strand DNA-binding protein
MSSLNRCEFIGNLGADPDIRHLSNGTKMAKFSIAVTETYTNQQGEKVSNTEWISVVSFSKLSDVIEKYVKKGDKLFVSGKWMTNKWVDEVGNNRERTELNLREMVMLGSPQSQGTSQPKYEQRHQNPQPQNTQQSQPQPEPPTEDKVDDLPF